MVSVIKKILGALLFLVPALAMATTVSPGNGYNAWDIYTLGNGSVIVQILQATIAIIGNSSYRTLLLLVASGGFLFLAIQAGFDFGKNFMKMFVYIFVVFLVLQTSTTITMNVQVDDEIKNSYQGVSNVPVVVGFPAAAITGIGHWLSQNIATAFGVDPMLSVSGGVGGTGGGFNIFGDMMEDANNYIITSPELKNSLASYTGDCVVAALGMGILTPSAMESSPNLWTTFGTGSVTNPGEINSGTATLTAVPQAVMTRYYYPANGGSLPSSYTCPGDNQSFAPSGSGTIVSCLTAYRCLSNDLANHAQGLLDAKQSQWAATGAVTPYSTAFQAAIEQVSGGNNNGGNITPASLVEQESLINEMRGSFRSAAAQTGDNSLLISANVTSAEQQQKSAFYVGSLVAEHMAGYVFTVLQAFLFAIVPIIIVAALIPGLGRQVAVSFIQMLVWLALWEPMYEIVNFLILAFSTQSVGVTFSTWSGPTMGNQFTMSEQTSNLVAAARMLGSSVPILALGLVKGGIALEKFAADTLGAEWGKSAGQAAAQGAFQEGGVGLSQVNGNKYNTASESVVGSGATKALTNSGALYGETNLGGEGGLRGGQTLGRSFSAQSQENVGGGTNTNAAVNYSGGENRAAGHRSETSNRLENSRNFSESQNSGHQEALNNGVSKSSDARTSHDSQQSENQQHTGSLRKGNDGKVGTSGGIGDKGSLGKPSQIGPQEVTLANGGGALGGGAVGGGALGGGVTGAAHGAPGAAGAAMPGMGGGMAGTTASPGGPNFKSGHGGLTGDIGLSGSNSMSRSMDSGISATSTMGDSSSQSYSNGVSSQTGISHSDSVGSGTSMGHNMSSAHGASTSHNADSNTTWSHNNGTGTSTSSQVTYGHSSSMQTSGGGEFHQGDLGAYNADTHFGNDGYWDRASAASAIGQMYVQGMAEQGLYVDGSKISGGADAVAARGGVTDPGTSSIPGNPNMGSLAETPAMSASWTQLLDEKGAMEDKVKQNASNTHGNVMDMHKTFDSGVTNLVPATTFDFNSASGVGATMRPGLNTADEGSLAVQGIGGLGSVFGSIYQHNAAKSAAKLSSSVNP